MRTCICISRAGKRERGDAGGMRSHHQYIPNRDPKRAKQLRAVLRCNRNFCVLTPLKRGQNSP